MGWMISKAMARAGHFWPLILVALSAQSFWDGEKRWGVAFLFLAWAAYAIAAMADSVGTITMLLASAGLGVASDAEALRRAADDIDPEHRR